MADFKKSINYKQYINVNSARVLGKVALALSFIAVSLCILEVAYKSIFAFTRIINSTLVSVLHKASDKLEQTKEILHKRSAALFLSYNMPVQYSKLASLGQDCLDQRKRDAAKVYFGKYSRLPKDWKAQMYKGDNKPFQDNSIELSKEVSKELVRSITHYSTKVQRLYDRNVFHPRETFATQILKHANKGYYMPRIFTLDHHNRPNKKALNALDPCSQIQVVWMYLQSVKEKSVEEQKDAVSLFIETTKNAENIELMQKQLCIDACIQKEQLSREATREELSEHFQDICKAFTETLNILNIIQSKEHLDSLKSFVDGTAPLPLLIPKRVKDYTYQDIDKIGERFYQIFPNLSNVFTLKQKAYIDGTLQKIITLPGSVGSAVKKTAINWGASKVVSVTNFIAQRFAGPDIPEEETREALGTVQSMVSVVLKSLLDPKWDPDKEEE
ncbi:MAG: hypothetical protein KAH32_01615 [Chlamydiia bacterium]|nr:hypothetical protein [Chlamydiia bacterium]